MAALPLGSEWEGICKVSRDRCDIVSRHAGAVVECAGAGARTNFAAIGERSDHTDLRLLTSARHEKQTKVRPRNCARYLAHACSAIWAASHLHQHDARVFGARHFASSLRISGQRSRFYCRWSFSLSHRDRRSHALAAFLLSQSTRVGFRPQPGATRSVTALEAWSRALGAWRKLAFARPS